MNILMLLIYSLSFIKSTPEEREEEVEEENKEETVSTDSMYYPCVSHFSDTDAVSDEVESLQSQTLNASNEESINQNHEENPLLVEMQCLEDINMKRKDVDQKLKEIKCLQEEKQRPKEGNQTLKEIQCLNEKNEKLSLILFTNKELMLQQGIAVQDLEKSDTDKLNSQLPQNSKLNEKFEVNPHSDSTKDKVAEHLKNVRKMKEISIEIIHPEYKEYLLKNAPRDEKSSNDKGSDKINTSPPQTKEPSSDQTEIKETVGQKIYRYATTTVNKVKDGVLWSMGVIEPVKAWEASKNVAGKVKNTAYNLGAGAFRCGIYVYDCAKNKLVGYISNTSGQVPISLNSTSGVKVESENCGYSVLNMGKMRGYLIFVDDKIYSFYTKEGDSNLSNLVCSVNATMSNDTKNLPPVINQGKNVELGSSEFQGTSTDNINEDKQQALLNNKKVLQGEAKNKKLNGAVVNEKSTFDIIAIIAACIIGIIAIYFLLKSVMKCMST